MQILAKKKNEALKSTWSDEESKGSQEEDDLVSNQIAFSGSLVSNNCVLMQGCAGVVTESVCFSAKSGYVALENKSATNSDCGSEFDCGDESEKDDESLHEAYEKMYAQWLKVCASNRALNGKIQVLHNLNAKAKVRFLNLNYCLLKNLRISSQSLPNSRELKNH